MKKLERIRENLESLTSSGANLSSSKATDKSEKRYLIDFLPNFIDSKNQVRTGIKFAGNGYLVASYKDTGTQIVANIKKPKEIERVANKFNILCKRVEFPHVISYHEDYKIQVFNINDAKCQKFMDTTFEQPEQPDIKNRGGFVNPREKNVVSVPKPQAILFDDQHLVLVFPKLIKVWARTEMKLIPKNEISIENNPLNGIQERFCQLDYPRLTVATHRNVQVWDITDKGKLLYDLRNENQTSTFIHVKTTPDGNLLACTSSTIYLAHVNSPNEPPNLIPTEKPITAMYMDNFYLITGDKDGLVSTYHSKTGIKISDLNHTPDRSLQNLDYRINSLHAIRDYDKVWVFAAHEDNRVTVWDFDVKKADAPVKVYPTPGPARELFLEGDTMYSLIKTDSSPIIMAWLTKVGSLQAQSKGETRGTDRDVILQCLYGTNFVKPPQVVQVDTEPIHVTLRPATVETTVFEDDLVKEEELDTTVFGVSLEDIMTRPQEMGVPSFMQNAIHYLTSEGLYYRNIFKYQYQQKDIDAFKEKANSGMEMDWYLYDAAFIAEMVKVFLDELPEPLLTFQFYEQFLQAAALPLDQRKVAIPEVFEKIPRTNKLLGHVLLVLLARVSENKDWTMMTVSQLGQVFGPLLLRPRFETRDTTLQTPQLAAVGRCLIEYIGIPMYEQHKKDGLIPDLQPRSEEQDLKDLQRRKEEESKPEKVLVSLLDEMDKPKQATHIERVFPDLYDKDEKSEEQGAKLTTKQKKQVEEIGQVIDELESSLSAKFDILMQRIYETSSTAAALLILEQIHYAKTVLVDGKEVTNYTTENRAHRKNQKLPFGIAAPPLTPFETQELLLMRKIVEGSVQLLKQKIADISKQVKSADTVEHAVKLATLIHNACKVIAISQL